MGDSVTKWFMDGSYLEEPKKEEPTNEVLNILELFRNLSIEDKVNAKKLIREEKL